MEEIASPADLGTGAGSGAGAGVDAAGISTEMAEMASAGVLFSVDTVCGTFWL